MPLSNIFHDFGCKSAYLILFLMKKQLTLNRAIKKNALVAETLRLCEQIN
jgi:hypothetical protein